MNNMSSPLSQEPIEQIEIDSKHITILGTAHVSRVSAEKVAELINSGNYDAVAIELCESRYKTIINPDEIVNMDLFNVIRSGKAAMVTASLALGAYQQRLAEQLGIDAGAEMRSAIQLARKHSLSLFLIDREIGITLKRIYRNVSFWRRMYLMSGLFVSLLTDEKVTEQEIEKLKSGDMLETAFSQFSENAKDLFGPLIEERNQYMAAKLKKITNENSVNKILAVVGAGHIKGMKNYLRNEQRLSTAVISELEQVPEARSWLKYIPWLIVIVILLGFAIGFWRSPQLGWNLVTDWILITGGLSALGSFIAGAHPLTILSAFLGAPITTLNPAIGVGMITVSVEIFLRKPTVNDFKNLRKDTTKFSGWRKNRVARVLLVFLLSSLGAAVGLYLAGFQIFDKITSGIN